MKPIRDFNHLMVLVRAANSDFIGHIKRAVCAERDHIMIDSNLHRTLYYTEWAEGQAELAFVEYVNGWLNGEWTLLPLTPFIHRPIHMQAWGVAELLKKSGVLDKLEVRR